MIETVAEEIAEDIMSCHGDDESSVKVRIKKPQVSLSGVLDHVAIEIERFMEDYQLESGDIERDSEGLKLRVSRR